jgi:CubicO group peptidase (beta-lactamase class C family)
MHRAGSRQSLPILLVALAACFTAPSAPAADAGAGSSDAEGLAPKLQAIVVVRDGEVADERYFSGATAESLLNTRSVTKTVTAMLVGAAIADGRLAGVSAPVAPVLGPDRDWADIRIVDLLTMSSALDCNDSDPKSPGNEENMYPLLDWHAWARRVPLDPGYARDAQGRGPFRYCTAGVMLLAQLLEAATGEKVERYAEARLFKPLGIVKLNWSRSPSGDVMPGGGLELTGRDLAKLGVLLARQGVWDGRPLLPADFVDAMLATQRSANAAQDYGYLIWRRTYRLACGEFTLPYMAGNGGNAVVILPALDGAVVVARTAYNTRGMHDQTTTLLERELLPGLLCGALSEPASSP